MSEVKLLARGGGGPGLLAALMAPRGDEDVDMVGAAMLLGVRREGGLVVSAAAASSLFESDGSAVPGGSCAGTGASEFSWSVMVEGMRSVGK